MTLKEMVVMLVFNVLILLAMMGVFVYQGNGLKIKDAKIAAQELELKELRVAEKAQVRISLDQLQTLICSVARDFHEDIFSRERLLRTYEMTVEEARAEIERATRGTNEK
jgi:type IV secretory pathway TrbF-like protein